MNNDDIKQRRLLRSRLNHALELVPLARRRQNAALDIGFHQFKPVSKTIGLALFLLVGIETSCSACLVVETRK